MRRAPQIAVLVAALALPTIAFAQTTAAVTFDAERLELNPSGNGSAVVSSAELLPGSTFRSSIIAHYANEPLVFSATGSNSARLIRERLTLHLTRQYSIAQRVELAVLIPVVVYQSGDDPSLGGLNDLKLSPGGLASPVLSARVGLLRTSDGAPFDLAMQFSTALPFGSANAFARNPGFTLAPRLIGSLKLFDAVMLSAEGGGLLRPPVTFGNSVIHNELSGNLGVATLHGVGRIEAAVRGGYYFEKAPSSLEIFLGGRYALTDKVDLTAVAAYGAARAPGTPLFRILFGASFTEGATKANLAPGTPAVTPPPMIPSAVGATADKPGSTAAKPGEKPANKTGSGTTTTVANFDTTSPALVQSAASACVAGKSHDPKSCPDLDLDSDGLRNSADTCPAAAEDKDGFQDEDGCPDPDNDGDSILDAQDKCPTDAGTADREGCPIPDEDKDGVEDAQDQCPKNAGPAERKGCPLTDSDGDGLLDAVDGCPNESGPVEARGCPVKDTDEDTVPDHIDNCPKEKGTTKNRGCPPAQKQFVYITKEKLVITDTVHFATNSARVLPKSFNLLKQVASVIKDHPEIKKIRVEGHTDNRGNRLKNLRLSQQRADSVRRYLILQGVEIDRLESRGFGPSRPIMPNLTPRGRAANRRVEFVIPDDSE